MVDTCPISASPDLVGSFPPTFTHQLAHGHHEVAAPAIQQSTHYHLLQVYIGDIQIYFHRAFKISHLSVADLYETPEVEAES